MGNQKQPGRTRTSVNVDALEKYLRTRDRKLLRLMSTGFLLRLVAAFQAEQRRRKSLQVEPTDGA